MDLQGKTILVTGAARGLGQKMAELIANQGANLALVVDHEELKETVRLCSKDGNKVKDYAADVTQESSVEQLFRSIQHDLGGVDGSINNAGKAAPAHGHPIGATGAIYSMQGDGINRGVVTLCIGGGQGIALALESLR